MSPYIEAGYAVVLGTLGCYSVILIGRERRAVARLRSAGVTDRRRRTAPAPVAAAAVTTPPAVSDTPTDVDPSVVPEMAAVTDAPAGSSLAQPAERSGA